jgi:glycine betaine/proline transport system permease protein
MNNSTPSSDTALLAPLAETNPWATATEVPTGAVDGHPAATSDASSGAAQDAAASQAVDPWGAPASSSETVDTAGDWLDAPAALGNNADTSSIDSSNAGFQIQQLWDGSLPIESWINQGLGWVVDNFRPFFQTVRAPIDTTLRSVEGLLTGMPTLAMLVILGLLAWQLAGRATAVGAVISLLLVAMLGIWSEAMVTLSLVLTSLVFCLVVGLPMGILLASSDRAQRWSRPFLDAMQTTPAFVYLVPVVMLFGIGNVPGVIVTIVFALPPLVRLTNLGIRQVRPDLIEAARAYGASPWQLLVKVQVPLAMPSIMAGINQALMLSLSMVVIASMIAVGGLGQMVLRGIGRLDMGLATVGGLGIVLLAITLDRITQAMGRPGRGSRHWWQTGPVALMLRLIPRRGPPAATSGTATLVPANR